MIILYDICMIYVLYASIRGIVGRVVCRFETRFFFLF